MILTKTEFRQNAGNLRKEVKKNKPLLLGKTQKKQLSSVEKQQLATFIAIANGINNGSPVQRVTMPKEEFAKAMEGEAGLGFSVSLKYSNITDKEISYAPGAFFPLLSMLALSYPDRKFGDSVAFPVAELKGRFAINIPFDPYPLISNPVFNLVLNAQGGEVTSRSRKETQIILRADLQ